MIDIAQAINISIDGARHFDKYFWLGGFLEGSTINLKHVAIRALATPVTGVGAVVPCSGDAGFAEIEGANTGAATVVSERSYGLVSKIHIKTWVAVIFEAREVVQTHIPATTVVGIVTGKKIERGGDGNAVGIAGPI